MGNQEKDTSFLDFLEEGIANAFDAEYEKEREYKLIQEYAVEEKTNEIAKKMLKYMPLDKVSECTGLSKTELLKL